MNKQRKAKTIRLTEQDEQAIAALKASYGITSDASQLMSAASVLLP
jgi:hypothetical protein